MLKYKIKIISVFQKVIFLKYAELSIKLKCKVQTIRMQINMLNQNYLYKTFLNFTL